MNIQCRCTSGYTWKYMYCYFHVHTWCYMNTKHRVIGKQTHREGECSLRRHEAQTGLCTFSICVLFFTLWSLALGEYLVVLEKEESLWQGNWSLHAQTPSDVFFTVKCQNRTHNCTSGQNVLCTSIYNSATAQHGNSTISLHSLM